MNRLNNAITKKRSPCLPCTDSIVCPGKNESFFHRKTPENKHKANRLLSMADKALYQPKANGRNLVTLHKNPKPVSKHRYPDNKLDALKKSI